MKIVTILTIFCTNEEIFKVNYSLTEFCHTHKLRFLVQSIPVGQTQAKERKKRKVILKIDPNELVRQTTSTTNGLGMSARQTAMTLASVVKAGGGDLTKSGVHRQRKKARAIHGKNLISNFVHSPKFILHYDTKLVNPKGRDTEDRAAVLYSGGEHKQPYLLGIPRFESSSGKDV